MHLYDEYSLPKDAATFLARNNITSIHNLRSQNEVWIYSVEENGTRNLHHHGPNLVVNQAKQILANLISGDAEYFLTKGKYGNCNYENDSIVNIPIPPSVDNTDLVDPEPVDAEVTVSDIYNIPGTSKWGCLFSLVLGKNAGNGTPPEGGGVAYKSYTEIGLYTESGLMYARKTFPTFVKTYPRIYQTLWSVVFI